MPRLLKRLIVGSLALAMLSFLALTAYAVSALCLFCSAGPDRRHVFESFETPNEPKIRVLMHPERAFLGGGPYLRFESRPRGATEWKEIATFAQDSVPGPIPQDQVRQVTDQVAFFFIGCLYAVTTDGGATWSTFGASKEVHNWECRNFGVIEHVTIHENGMGIMRRTALRGEPEGVTELQTSDFGRTWHARDLTRRCSEPRASLRLTFWMSAIDTLAAWHVTQGSRSLILCLVRS